MTYSVNIYSILLIVITTFLASFLIMFPVRKFARYIGAVDYPNEERRIHKEPTPRMGVIAIFLSFLLGYMIFGNPTTQMIAILIGSFLLVTIGLFDDIKPIPNRYKFLFQLLAACIAVFYGNFLIKEITAFGMELRFGWAAYPLTIFFILGCVNCINLIDGMDGLASGLCSVFFLTIGIIGTMNSKFGGLDIVLAFCALGSTLGYLKHNFHPAKIFMGDGGSMFLGYLIAIISLIGYKNVAFTSFLVPLTLLAIPIIDTLFAIIRRTLKHQNPLGTPDKEHVHYQLLKASKSVKKSVLIIYAVDLVFAAISIFYVLGNNRLAMIMYSFVTILIFILIAKTNILYEHRDKSKKEGKK